MTTLPRCPYCLDDLLPEQARSRCAGCRTPHHAVCFEEHGGCVAYGCGGELQVEAGLSLYARAQLGRLEVPALPQADLGPFLLTHQALPAVPLLEAGSRFGPYVRLSLEDQEVREGGVVRGRAVIHTPRELTFRRFELALLQGIRAQRRLARAVLLGEEGLLTTHTLGPGFHPFHLELRAPEVTPPVDPFLLEVVLVGRLVTEITSGALPLFLLQRRDDDPAPAIAEPPRPRIRIAPRGEEAAPGALSGSGDGTWQVPVHSAGSLLDSAVPTGRSAQARLCRAAGAPRDRITLEAPALPVTPELAVRVLGGPALSFLNLAVHYELVRPGGVEVRHDGFPTTEEVRLVGERGVPPGAFADAGGIELSFQVPEERLAALAGVRRDGAHNAALRLRLAVDAMDAEGRRVKALTRSVTYT